MFKNKLLLLAVLVFSVGNADGQNTFQTRYGTAFHDRSRCTVQTQDGNFIIAGGTDGFGSGGNALMMKVDASGTILWAKDFAGINLDEIFDVIELNDGSLVMCGVTNSFGAGNIDGFVTKTDNAGYVIWSKPYGNIFGEHFLHIAKDETNGFYVAAYVQQVGLGNEQGSAIIKLDSVGNILWTQWVASWLALGDWYPISMTPIASGGVVLASQSSGTGYEISCWKFSSAGNLVWSNRYELQPASTITGVSIVETTDAALVLYTAIGNVNTVAHSVDNCIIKLNASGGVLFCKSYGGTYTDWMRSLCRTTDGGVMLCGATNSAGNGDEDASLIKLLSDGTLQWAQAYGDVWDDRPAFAVQTLDGGFAITGQTFALGVDPDSAKIHFVKTDSLGNVGCHNVAWQPVTVDHSVTSQFR